MAGSKLFNETEKLINWIENKLRDGQELNIEGIVEEAAKLGLSESTARSVGGRRYMESIARRSGIDGLSIEGGVKGRGTIYSIK